MILKKPYAVLIKYFRHIHLILSILIAYLVYKTSAMLSFITDYLVLPTTYVNPSTTKSLFPIWIYFIVIFLNLGYIVIILLMKFKEKPVTFYAISIATSIFTIIIYVYAQGTVSGLETTLTDIRTLKLNQDLLRTVQILQFFITIITIIRATGFDIKKFNFSKDLETLAIEEKDNEEFELNVEVDSTHYKRGFKRLKRYAKYIIVENKFMLITGTFLLCFLALIFYYLNTFVYNKVYKIGETIEANDLSFHFKTAYRTLYDYQDKEKNKTAYVIVNFDVKKLFGDKKKLETARLYLTINNRLFYHKKNDQDQFFDLGTVYNNEEVKTEFENYNLIYEIPSKFIDDDMYLIYEEISGKRVRIKVNSKKLELPTKEKKYKLADTLSFQESLMKKSTFKIQNYGIEDFYKNSYTYCISEDNCYDSVEYITPSFTDNYTKSLLRIESEYKVDDTLRIKGIENIIDFLNNFGVIHYQFNKESKSFDDIRIVKPKNTNEIGVYYIEVPNEMKSADQIWIEIKLRDKKYLYTLK